MKPIRDAYGLTQELLAGYLGLTRSQLSVAETENRQMPVKALEKCTQLLQLLKLQKSPKQLVAIDRQQQQDLRKELAKRRKQVQAKIGQLNGKLTSMQASYQQCSNSLLAVQEILPTLGNTREQRKDKLWLEMLEAEVLSQLDTCGVQPQQLLRLDIISLEAELVRIGEMGG